MNGLLQRFNISKLEKVSHEANKTLQRPVTANDRSKEMIRANVSKHIPVISVEYLGFSSYLAYEKALN